ncbi:MAG: hypothetical protein WCV84_03285 [Patescibacteria group bacterium]
MSHFFSDRPQVPGVSAEPRQNTHLVASLLFSFLLDACIYGIIFFVPLAFATSILDALEISKQTVLFSLVLLAVTAWIGKMLAERHLSFSKSWLHTAVMLFGAGYFVVALFSEERYASLIGTAGQTSWSFLTIASCILLYLVIVNRVRSLAQVYNMVLAFLASSFVAACFGLLQMAGWHLFSSPVAKELAFTTAGSTYGLAIFLTVPLVMSAVLLMHGCRDNVCLLGSDGIKGMGSRLIVWLTAITSFLVLLFTDMRAAWGILFVCLLGSLALGYFRTRRIGKPVHLAFMGALLLIAGIFLFAKFPWKATLPSEITPSFRASWHIAQRVLEQHPLLGSGPGTWLYDYALHRDPLVNQSPFWAVRFDRGYSTAITSLATLGILGFGLWLALLISALVKSWAHVLRERDDDTWYAFVTVLLGWMAAVLIAFVYNVSFVHQLAFWFPLALLGALSATKGFVVDTTKAPSWQTFLAIGFTLMAITTISGWWLMGQRIVAEQAYTQAVRFVGAEKYSTQARTLLEKARSLNPFVETYVRALSQAHLGQAMAIVSGQPTQEQAREVRVLVGKSIDYGKLATEQWPMSPEVWANLGSVYQSVSGFADDADQFALKNYEEAHRREPQNPVYMTEIGKLYFQRAEADRIQTGVKDEKVRTAAKERVKENLDAAARWLRAAINLKSDFLPARYFMGVVFERQGRLMESVKELELILQQNTQDTNIAFELAILYFRSGNRERGIALMERVVRADAANANAKWYLSSMYEAIGRRTDALELVEQLAQKYPTNAAIATRLNDLKQPVQKGRLPLPEPLKEQTY